jgi:pimeloyl-ACP methyl ester carboxylesterase
MEAHRRRPLQGWNLLLVVLAIAAAAAGARAAEPLALKTTELGAGPTLVLVHDLGAGRLAWMPVARRLIGRYHVVMVDLPGHGESPMPDGFTFNAAAAALDLVVAKQKPDSTLVVGHGVGGVVALLEAAAHPEHLRGVVVMSAAAKSPIAIPDQQRDAFLQQLDANYAEMTKALFTNMGRDSAQGAAAYAQAALVAPATMKAYLRELLVLDATPAVKNLTRPLLFIGGGREWPADRPWSEQAKRFGYDGAKDVIPRRFGSAGHYVPQDVPDSTAAAIAEFAATSMAGAGAKH